MPRFVRLPWEAASLAPAPLSEQQKRARRPLSQQEACYTLAVAYCTFLFT
jgi:hypothetical protein